MGTSRWPEAEYHVQSVLAQAHDELDDHDLAEARAAGATMTLDDLIDLLTGTA